MNETTGSDWLIASMEWANAGRAARSSGGDLRRSSIRSWWSGLRISRRRSWIVGRASWTRGRRAAKNGARRLVAGLDAATRTSRSSSVWRRLTNVVLPRRRVSGSTARALDSDVRSEAIAPVAVEVLETRLASVAWRWASAVTTREPVETRPLNACWSRIASEISWLEVDSSGEK